MLKWQERGGGIYFSGLKLISQDVLLEGGFAEKIGKEYLFKDKHTALTEIYSKLDKNICETCEIKAFEECNT